MAWGKAVSMAVQQEVMSRYQQQYQNKSRQQRKIADSQLQQTEKAVGDDFFRPLQPVVFQGQKQSMHYDHFLAAVLSHPIRVLTEFWQNKSLEMFQKPEKSTNHSWIA